jgi:hypothetical protein
VGAPLAAQRATTAEDARRIIAAVSDDSLQGRYNGSAGAMKAARMIAEQMRAAGLEPAGDDGFFQRVPTFAVPPTRPNGLEVPRLAADFAALDTLPRGQHRESVNVVGLLRGSDSTLREEFVLVGAHYDHVGMNPARAVNGDSIWNGADDDASGVAAMLETARQLREGGAPKRTVIFVAFTGEENGFTGTRWYIAHPARPLEQTVADLQIEMIGRPDSVVGGAGTGWLTGFERSTMGQMLADAGIPIVADPRPEEGFFTRSDNYPFAQKGIPAHTLSSFGGHRDYHAPSDEVGRMDLAHVATMINAAARAVRVIADGVRVEWLPGGRP